MSSARLVLGGGHVRLELDGPVQERTVEEAWLDTLRQLAERHAKASRSLENVDELLAIGRELHDWFVSRFRFDALRAKLTGALTLTVEVPREPGDAGEALLHAPWELLADEKGHLVADSIVRYAPVRRLGAEAEAKRPQSEAALSVLFMAAVVDGQQELQLEEEERAILEATHEQPLDLFVEETGTLRELRRRHAFLSEDAPVDVLHLSCHGTATPNPALLLEDAYGAEARTDADDITKELGSKLGDLGLVVLSACETAAESTTGPAESLAAALVQRGAPATLGFASAVGDASATKLTASLYERLSLGDDVVEAVAAARREALTETGSRDWHLARLVLGPRGGDVVAPVKGRRRKRRDRGYAALLNEQDREVKVAGPEAFVGRRRPLQESLRVLREPGPGLLIHGLGRQGKSSLAVRIAERLEGLTTVPLHGDYRAVTILSAIAHYTGRDEWKERHEPIVKESPAQLDRALREALNDDGAPFLLLIDDLERVLDDRGGERHQVKADDLDTLSAVLRVFDAEGNTESRLLFTSRFRFELSGPRGDLGAGLHELSLQSMEPHEARKQAIATAGRAELAWLDRAVAASHGNAGLLDRLLSMREAEPELADTALKEMERLEATGEHPEQAELLEFFARISIQVLLDALDESQHQLLRCWTLFEHPVPESLLAPLAEAGCLAEPEQALARLTSLGLLEVSPDLVDPERKALRVTPLASRFLEPLQDEERRHLGQAVLPTLTNDWQDWASSSRRGASAHQLAELGLLSRDVTLLHEVTLAGIAWLDDRHRSRRAAEVVLAAIPMLEEADQTPETWLYLRGADVAVQPGEVDAALRWLETVDGRSEELDDDTRASLWLRQARLLSQRGAPEEALAKLEAARKTREHQPRQLAVVLGEIARIKNDRGDVDEALSLHQEQIELFEALGDLLSRTVTLGDIARIKNDKGDVDQALSLHQDRLAVHETLGDQRSRAITLGDIARIKNDKGDVDQALSLHQEQIQLFEALGDQRSRAVALGDLARIKNSRGEVDEALSLHQEELAVYEALGDQRSRAVTLGDIARIRKSKGDVDQALSLHQERLAVYEALGDQRSRAVT
ncbi:MAG: CHAT domain-containing protein, partial [Acidobacteriota bacterium]